MNLKIKFNVLLVTLIFSGFANAQTEQIDAILETTNKAIDTGARIYQIFKDGRGSSTYVPASDPISAVPEGVSSMDLEFSKSRNHEINLLKGTSNSGLDLYELTVRIDYAYDLKYQGRGKYLKDVTITPSKFYAKAGYELTATVLFSGVSNIRSSANPIPRLKFTVNYKVNAPTLIYGGDRDETVIIYVDGTGHVYIDNKKLTATDWKDPEPNDLYKNADPND